jgi:hypothetical protein
VLADQCQAVFNFALGGGGDVSVDGDVFTYPPTRVLVDVCLEPLADPISRNVACSQPAASPAPTTTTACAFAPGADAYQPSGVEVKLIVSTGFPSFALSSSAFDRLRGPGSAAAALAQSQPLHLPDVKDDGPGATGLAVGPVTLGGGELAALALVSHIANLGPCSELARSRRQRRAPPGVASSESGCLVQPVASCQDFARSYCVRDDCDDSTADTAAVIELNGPLDAVVIDDASPLFTGINADVRTANATVEGVIGTDLLRRLRSTIDYPSSRLVARCADDNGCLTYPRYTQSPSGCSDDSLCHPPSDIARAPRPGGACLATDP